MHRVPDRNFHLLLLTLVTLNLVTHVDEHAILVLVLGGACVLWRAFYEFQRVRLPNWSLKVLLVVASFYLVYLLHGRVTGVEAASALLLAAVSLKLIDNVSYRDAMVLLFLNFILLMCRFLVSQTLAMTIFSFLVLVVVSALLLHLHNGKDVHFSWPKLLKMGVRITLQTAPLLILLFFVFPRFSTGFFSLSAPLEAKTGFSDELEPGQISKLVLSGAPAFRVKFSGENPTPQQMYWKGAVLSENLGMVWKRTKSDRYSIGSLRANLDGLLEQEIVLEPGYGKWLFVLDTPHWVEFSDRRKQMSTYKSVENIFSTKNEVGQRVLYKAFSSSTPITKLSHEEKEFYMEGPPLEDPRIEALVQSIRVGTKTDGEVVENLLDFFSREFRYTLEPGSMKTKAVAEFVFDKKIGFCEHFAAAFAYIIRRAEVPSRVVIGFQGGRKNNLSDYYIIKEKDAHAWVEVWLKEKSQWVRVDPTEVVAPMRLQLGGEIFHSLPEAQISAGLSEADLVQLYESNWANRYFGKLSLAVDIVATRWNHFLLTFDFSGQKKLLGSFGFKNLTRGRLGLISVFILAIFLLGLRWRHLQHASKEPPEQVLYANLCHLLNQKGCVKSPSEGPQQFMYRCLQACDNSELQAHLRKFTNLYIQVHYGPPSFHSQAHLSTMKQLLIACKNV